MAKESKPDTPEPKSTLPTPAATILGAVAIVGVFAALAIAGTMFVLARTDDKKELAELPGFAAQVPPIDRSAAADLLANKSFDEMSQSERDLVIAEVTRVFDNAEFRASSQLVLGIDVIRRDGVTRAIDRYWSATDKEGDPLLRETISFFCESEVDGYLDVFSADRTILASQVSGDRIVENTQAFQRTLSAMDWTMAKDLGFDEFDGRRVHGIETPWNFVSGQGSSISQAWFDVENARLLRRVEKNTAGELLHDYRIDWRVPPRIVPPPDLKPPCYDEIYPS